jgi:hypothetical protein
LDLIVSYTQQLYQLQKINSRVQAINDRLVEIAANLVESDALKQARANLAVAETACKEISAQVTDLELEVRGLQQKIAQNEERLYSGRIASPKEASNLQDDVASSKRWLAKREEELLEVMIEYEDHDAERQKCAETLERVLPEWEADQAGLLQARAALQEERETLTKSRETVVTFIPEDELSIYEQLRRKYGGVGLAEVEDGTCLACGVMLSSRVAQQAHTDSQLYYCDNCHRIIHVL